MFVVIGTTTVDLFLSGLDQLPATPEADEFTNDNFSFCEEPLRAVLGGNAGSAFTLARLGADVTVSSAVGADHFGKLARRWHAQAGVDVSALAEVETATSTTTVLSDGDLNRRSFHHPGATAAFAPGMLDGALLDKTEVLLVSGYPLLERWRPEGVRHALAHASGAGAVTALDIGPAVGDPARGDELVDLLPFLDYLIANEHELAVCTGREDLGEATARTVDAGAERVVVKQGGGGAVLHHKGRAEPLQAPAFTVEARFTVGAGDAFNAGLLFGVSQGWKAERVLRFGNAVAALVVQNARGVLGSPDQQDAEALMAS